MAYLYILENKKGRYYIGITDLMPEERLRRHNNGDVYSTKFNRPWKQIYIEKFRSIKEARVREK